MAAIPELVDRGSLTTADAIVVHDVTTRLPSMRLRRKPPHFDFRTFPPSLTTGGLAIRPPLRPARRESRRARRRSARGLSRFPSRKPSEGYGTPRTRSPFGVISARIAVGTIRAHLAMGSQVLEGREVQDVAVAFAAVSAGGDRGSDREHERHSRSGPRRR